MFSATIETVNLNFHQLDPSVYLNPIITAVNRVVPQIPSLAIGLLVAILLIRIITRVVKFFLALTAMSAALRSIIAGALEIMLWVLFAMQALQLLGFGGIVIFFSTSVAAIGLVMAAGGSTFISDVLAGVYLAGNKNFAIGDEVMVGSLYGTEQHTGVIESLDTRRVYLRDKEGKLHVLPNSFVERRDWVVIKPVETMTPLGSVRRTVKKARRVAQAAASKGQMADRQVHRRGSL